MASPAGARAERSLRLRHQDAWPRSLYAYDLDEVRRVTDRVVLTESPRGLMALTAEYKATDDGPLDLSELQFQIAGDVTRPDLPAFVVQFTHPELVPAQPWAFRLWPVNVAARPFGPVELTEVDYVRLAYLLAGGALAAGGEVVTYRDRRGRMTGVETLLPDWSELAHLDDRFPDPGMWPEVVPAKPRAFVRIAQPPRIIVERFLGEHGRLLGGTLDPVPVLRLPSFRQLEPVPPGPVSEVRRILAERHAPRPEWAQPVPAAAQLALDLPAPQRPRLVEVPHIEVPAAAVIFPATPIDVATRGRIDAELAELQRRYFTGGPSDDARDMYRPWNHDGSRRWARR